MVYVARDVTRQDNYQITYHRLDSEGKPVTLIVIPPLGSLVEFVEEPLSDAIAGKETYVIARTGLPEATLHSMLDDLHKKLYQQLNGNQASNSTVTPNNYSPYPQYVTGSFLTYEQYDNYQIDYVYTTTSTIEVTDHYLWTGSGDLGTDCASYLDWDTNSPHIYDYPVPNPIVPDASDYSGGIHTSLNWIDSPGFLFRTGVYTKNDVQNTQYEGYVTIS